MFLADHTAFVMVTFDVKKWSYMFNIGWSFINAMIVASTEKGSIDLSKWSAKKCWEPLSAPLNEIA